MNTDLTRVNRYAVYFSPPPDALWWEAGSRWLGHDAVTQAPLEQPHVGGLAPEQQRQLTQEPARYGWHATLKAPFTLSQGVTVADLRKALQQLAASFTAFDVPPLLVHQLGDFLALCPESDHSGVDNINAIASACVTQLDRLSAPLSADEFERRQRKGRLSVQEIALLSRWGYPYVMERYRFHMSLTGDLRGVDSMTVMRLKQAAKSWFSALPPCRFDGLSLFVEPTKNANFIFVERWGLA